MTPRTGRHGDRLDVVPSPPPAVRPRAARPVLREVAPPVVQRGPLVLRRVHVLGPCVVALVVIVVTRQWFALVPVLAVLWGVFRGDF